MKDEWNSITMIAFLGVLTFGVCLLLFLGSFKKTPSKYQYKLTISTDMRGVGIIYLNHDCTFCLSALCDCTMGCFNFILMMSYLPMPSISHEKELTWLNSIDPSLVNRKKMKLQIYLFTMLGNTNYTFVWFLQHLWDWCFCYVHISQILHSRENISS